MDEYLSIAGSAEAVYEISRSRFIAHLAITRDEQAARTYIEALRKKYWDARHNCAASLIGSHGEYQKADDDGEPSGTAGRPMLEVLKKQGLGDITVVVTRYFGGIKLGAGGLVRAYSKSVQLVVEAAPLIKRQPALQLKLTFAYDLLGNVEYYLRQEAITISDKQYASTAVFTIIVPRQAQSSLVAALTELTAGRCSVTVEKEVYLDLPLKARKDIENA